MSKYDRNRGKPWTTEDEEKLKQLYETKKQYRSPLRIIALKLGRTEYAVEKKYRGIKNQGVG